MLFSQIIDVHFWSIIRRTKIPRWVGTYKFLMLVCWSHLDLCWRNGRACIVWELFLFDAPARGSINCVVTARRGCQLTVQGVGEGVEHLVCTRVRIAASVGSISLSVMKLQISCNLWFLWHLLIIHVYVPSRNVLQGFGINQPWPKSDRLVVGWMVLR